MDSTIQNQIVTAADQLGAECGTIVSSPDPRNDFWHCRFRVKGRYLTVIGISPEHLLSKLRDRDYTLSLLAFIQ